MARSMTAAAGLSRRVPSAKAFWTYKNLDTTVDDVSRFL